MFCYLLLLGTLEPQCHLDGIYGQLFKTSIRNMNVHPKEAWAKSDIFVLFFCLPVKYKHLNKWIIWHPCECFICYRQFSLSNWSHNFLLDFERNMPFLKGKKYNVMFQKLQKKWLKCLPVLCHNCVFEKIIFSDVNKGMFLHVPKLGIFCVCTYLCVQLWKWYNYS